MKVAWLVIGVAFALTSLNFTYADQPCLRKNGLETEYKTGKKKEAAFNDRAMVSMGCKVPGQPILKKK